VTINKSSLKQLTKLSKQDLKREEKVKLTTNLNKPLAVRESPLMNQTIRRSSGNDFGTNPYEGQGSGL
jgi:hypothetical protein